MTLILRADQVQAMTTHAEAIYPEECCGLLLGTRSLERDRRTVGEILRLENQWTPEVKTLMASDLSPVSSKHNRYWIDPKALMEAQRYGRDRNWIILGVYHSHPDHPAQPSERDRSMAWTDYSYPILSVLTGKVAELRSWRLSDDRLFTEETLEIQQ